VLTLRVSTGAARYRISCYRCGLRNQLVYEDAEWHTEELAEVQTSAQWRPGAYIAVFESDPPQEAVRPDSSGRTLDARSARALFTVRREKASAPLLVVLPLFTYHAYNVAEVDGTLGRSEGDCLYSGAKWVSLHRPGGGTGGHPWDEVNTDAYDRVTPRQTFAHWDAKALAWLEREGFAYDVCTDLELHDGAVAPRDYALMASFGHHEYWTRKMRERVDAHIAAGGNAAFFGGNTCWFRAEYDPQSHAIRRDGRWLDEPEWKTTGVSYAYGGGKWIGERPASGFTVRRARHWLFDGLVLRDGDTFGFEERLLGYECDGAPVESDLLIAAEGPISHWSVSDGSGEVSEHACAALGIREARGRVFTASTADWARVLAQGNPVVRGITRNVLEYFQGDSG
jgi:hypothetical protein